MRIFVVAFAILAVAASAAIDSPVNEYLSPTEGTNALDITNNDESAVLADDGYQYKTLRRLKYRQRRDVSEIANEYLPPAEETSTEAVAEVKSAEALEDSAVLGENGYEYKTVRRLKYRQRRDVSEIANEYLPPAEETSAEAVAEVKSAEALEDSAVLGENGYEYKTVRRLKYRQRRDVSEIANEYLPPAEETSVEAVAELESIEEPEDSASDSEYLTPAEETSTEAVAELKSSEESEDSAILGEKGYEYKTVRRLKYRQRRDVSEIANEYLPPAEKTSTEAVTEVKSAEALEDSAVLGENGYEYKNIRRLKYRQRRDVSEIANEYLTPAEETSTEAVAELKSSEESEDSAILGEKGYEYKTVRRLKYRQRRDVSEIANEYLTPAEETSTEAVAELKSSEESEDSAILGENGYEYKTVRRLKYRQRRDVSEIANEYLPPAEETSTETVAEVKSDEEPKDSAVLGKNVSELANEYLPPVEEVEAIAEVKSVEEPEDSAVLGKTGYEYKTVRRLKYRQRRDVSEIANEYLPPAEKTSTKAVAEVKSAEALEDSAVLGENGYEYKNIRRLKYRQRRDVSEIANEYLPPAKETSTEAAAEAKSDEQPEDSAVLGKSVSEIANEYLPPAEETFTEAIAEVKSAEALEDSTVLGKNGYEYKTVRRLKYRQRRDVSEIANEYLTPAKETSTEAAAGAKSDEEPEDSAVLGKSVSEIANEYLPPAEETSTEAAAEVKSVEALEDSFFLGENGYEYKTVRRLKYRQRRDVSKIASEYLPPTKDTSTEAAADAKSDKEPEDSAVLGKSVSEIANEYLTPAEETSTETVAEVKSAEALEDATALGKNGYEYKTVRRLKYRQRRDVSEVANEYLLPVEETSSEAVAEVKSAEALEDSAVLGENGYEYKTVRRLKYRQRRDVSGISNE